MKTKDLLIITTVALSTATLTVAAFLGYSLEAGGDANKPTPTIAKPELVASGIEMTLETSAGREFKAGEAPSFDLRAMNTQDSLSEILVRLTMTATAPVSALSRMIPAPTKLWQEERTLTLGPNETKTFTFIANTNLPANRIISVSLLDVGQAKGVANANVAGAGAGPSTRPPGFLRQGIVALNFFTVPQGVALAASPSAPKR